MPEGSTLDQFNAAVELLKAQGKAIFDRDQVVAYLRAMDLHQKQQDEDGAAEVGWYYDSGDLCDLLGIDYEAEVNADEDVQERYHGPWPPPPQPKEEDSQ